LPRIALTGKDFVAGSTWWKWRFRVHRPYPQERAAAGLSEQDRPHLAMAARDRLAHTALAPPPAAALVEVKRDHAVTRAAPQLGRALAGWTANVPDTAIGLWHEHMFPLDQDGYVLGGGWSRV